MAGVFVKSHRRGKSVVKAYTRALLVQSRLTDRKNSLAPAPRATIERSRARAMGRARHVDRKFKRGLELLPSPSRLGKVKVSGGLGGGLSSLHHGIMRKVISKANRRKH